MKNIVLSYLTTADPSVHQNLVKVLVQALQFSEEETERVATFQSARIPLAKVSQWFF